MSFTAYKEIRDAINARLQANWTLTPIQWANTVNNPGKAAFIQPRLRFDDSFKASMGQPGERRIEGDVHVTVNVPIESGDNEAWQYIDALSELFYPSNDVLILPTTNHAIFFLAPSPREPDEDTDFFRVPVFFPFFYNWHE